MTAASDRLRQARERAGFDSAKSAAEAMGTPVATYIQHENGSRGFAKQVDRYARRFQVTPEWLIYGTRRDGPETFAALGPRLFMKGEVAAGVWRESWEFDEDEWQVFTGRADIVAPPRQRFGLRVVGDSMDMVYPPGTIVECVQFDGNDALTPGKRVVVQRTREDGQLETTVKEYVIDTRGDHWFVPRSTNPAFQNPFRADVPDPGIVRIEIIGIVVASIRPE